MTQLSVLLVDDNPHVLRILDRFLSEHSHGALRVVGSVVGGRDAVARAECLRPDVILLDLAMPDVCGLALLPRLREALPDAILIALSLLDPAEHGEAVKAAGADAFVSKASLERNLLPTLVREVCARLDTDRGRRHRDMPAHVRSWAELARTGRQEDLLNEGEGALLAACPTTVGDAH